MLIELVDVVMLALELGTVVVPDVFNAFNTFSCVELADAGEALCD